MNYTTASELASAQASGAKADVLSHTAACASAKPLWHKSFLTKRQLIVISSTSQNHLPGILMTGIMCAEGKRFFDAKLQIRVEKKQIPTHFIMYILYIVGILKIIFDTADKI